MTTKPYCSFCGKNADQVLVLIAGPTVHICESFADLCVDIVQKWRTSDKVIARLIGWVGEMPPK